MTYTTWTRFILETIVLHIYYIDKICSCDNGMTYMLHRQDLYLKQWYDIYYMDKIYT